MKFVKSAYLALAAVAALGFSACQDDVDAPGLVAPEASWKPNTTILDLKTRYWDDATNYIDTVALTDAGEHVIISGRVISSDASGNIYKSLVIQDETAALSLSINANSLYANYRIGQEVVIDVTDMYIGKYNGLQQLGFPEFYTQGNAWEATFMPLQFFKVHSQLNGLPEPSKVDTLAISYADISSATPDVLRRYQSQLVRFNGATFEGAGTLQFTDGVKITSNRTLLLADGNSIVVRTSGYSNFWSDLLPKGEGDVVGILSYYGTSGWQLLLRSRNDLLNFEGTSSGAIGSEDNPYTVDHVIEMEANDRTGSGWVSGIIAGAVAPGVTAVTSDSDIEWTSDVSMPNTLVIAPEAGITDYKACLVIELPQDSRLREYGNLLDHPENYGKEIKVKGSFGKVLSTWGITGNKGTSAEFRIEGVNVPGGDDNTPGGGDDPITNGDGSEASPYSTAQVISLGNPGTVSWVEGYIVGWIDGQVIASGAKFEVPATVASNLLLAASPSETDVTKCVPVQLVGGSAVRTALNLMDNPGNLGKRVKLQGELVAYFGKTGVKQTAAYAWIEGGDDNKPGGGDDNKPGTDPVQPGQTGTQEAPIDVTAAMALNNSGASAWVKGYVVGWVAGSAQTDARFGAPADRAGNILIAASPSETDPAKCMAVELPSKSAVRTALNLLDNPGVLGKEVVLNASLRSYLGFRGLTSPKAYELK
nr:hypothetical protein [Bacteroides sp.]